ncbi:MAG: ABC transporter ATP-binding protein [Microbacterium sp.]
MIRTLLGLLPEGTRPRVIAHLAMTVVSVILRALGAVVLLPILGHLFSPQPAQAWPWVGALVALTLAGWVIDWVIAQVGFSLGFGLLQTGQRSVADRIARTPLTWLGAENTATARQAIGATGPDLVGIIVYLVTPMLSAVLLPVALGLALLSIAWPLGVAALVGVPVLLGAYLLSTRLSRAADRAAADANTALTERVLEFARAQHALRAARRAEPERSQVGRALDAQHGAAVRLLLLQVPGQIVFGVASQVALILLAGTTLLLALDGALSAPEAIGLIVVIARYLEPFTTIAELSGGIEGATGVLRRIRTIMHAPELADGARSASGSAAPRIELRHASFRYAPDDAPVIDDLSLTIEPGSTTAIVGPSGSGKSTILALLAGLHQPTDGSILVDGQDVSDLSGDARRDLVSAVFQEPYLFDGTVRENVLAGDPGAGEERLSETARLARIDAVLARLPEGWESPVGEGGGTLSGGERQRVSIARALLKPAPVLLIDEATSALDTENERAISTALTEGTARTRVIVAHRLASIRNADRAVFLDEGRIVEDGTIDELRAAGGRFAEFWRRQDAAGAWRLGSDGRLPQA